MEKYEKNKHKTTLMFATGTSWVYYFPGYFCMPFDACTPDKYYPMTKSCLNTINSDDEEKNSSKKYSPSYRKIPTKDKFKEW